MNRSFQATLAVANQQYNLWTDIIAHLSDFDPTMSNSFYPSSACELQIQSDAVINPGMTITISYDKNLRGGTTLTAGSADLRSTNANSINIKGCNIKSDTAGAQINVEITSN